MEPLFLIALTTYRELVRSKVLYVVIFFAAIMVVVAALFGSVSIGDQSLVVKDFGLAVISLFSVAFAVIAGGSLLHKELSKKTIYNLLAKPVERYQFIWGKFLGMLATSAIILLLMGCGLILFAWAMTGELPATIAVALAYAILELMIVCAAAIFFSSLVVTPVLNGLFTFGFFLAGRSADYVLYFLNDGQLGRFAAAVLKALYYALPHLNELNVSSLVVFGEPGALSAGRFLWSALYALAYSAILLTLAAFFFRRRDFN